MANTNINSPTNPRRLKARERKQEALSLRMSGVTFEQIGQRLGITRQAAHKAVTQALADIQKETNEDAEKLRHLELERLDKMQASIWASVLTGGYGAIDRVLRIMERRAKLIGLDIEPDNPDNAVIEIHVVHDNDLK